MSEKGFRKWMDKFPETEYIGKVAVFYVPLKKSTPRIKSMIHDFFVSRHKAYTHESGDIRGYWHDGESLKKDSHDRYEISFSGEGKIREFIGFLSDLCGEMGELSIYLTIADEAYLIKPRN
jgi:hypothetical protein